MSRTAVVATSFAFLVAMIGTTVPTALYPIYADELGFSSLTVTILFAVYACGVFGRCCCSVGSPIRSGAAWCWWPPSCSQCSARSCS